MITSKTQIVALFGPQGGGKTFLANELCKYPGWERISFARPIREMVAVSHDIDPELLEKPEWKNAPIYPENSGSPTFRHILQDVGMWGRNIAPEFWLNILWNQIETSEDRHFVIDDMRFQNEFDFIRKKCHKWHTMVEVKPVGDFKNELPEQSQNHPSEVDWKNFPCNMMFINDGGAKSAAMFAHMLNQLTGE